MQRVRGHRHHPRRPGLRLRRAPGGRRLASDAKGPYDWNLTNTLIDCAEEACDPEKWNTQVCFHYSTDANAAYLHANNIAAGAFGMACTNTHGRERFHVDAMVETEKLTRAYVMGVGRE